MRDETGRIICSLKDLAEAVRAALPPVHSPVSLLREECRASQSHELPVALTCATAGAEAIGDAARRFGEAARALGEWLEVY